MRRILVTGATSMIGTALIKKLIENGDKIVAVVRENCTKLSKLPNSQLIEVIACNMDEYWKLTDKIEGTIDVAFATAWNGTRGSSRNDHVLQGENLKYNKDLLHAVIDLGCKVFITSGSQAEYGVWNESCKLSEDVVPNPNTEYGKHKLAFYEYAEKYCCECGCRLVEPRFFSLYGPYDFDGTLVMSMLKKLMNNETCDLTKCIQQWDFLYIDDAVDALKLLIDISECSGIYNFGSGYSAPLRKFVEIMAEITQSSSMLNYGAIPYPKTGIVKVNPNVQKLLSIGWQPKVSFEMGIKEIIKNMNGEIVPKNNEGWVKRSFILICQCGCTHSTRRCAA